jgi:diguanylate cyclase
MIEVKMKIAPLAGNEVARIAALHELDVLDSDAEEQFDAIVKTASLVCGVPISLISLVDVNRQWFKANLGLHGVTETPRDVAFCAHAILDEALFEVPDATKDPRFADNPIVTGNPDIRFYAGAPVTLSDGNRVGTLCVIDREPRVLNDTQREILKLLAHTAAAALEGRQAIALKQKLLHERQLTETRFRMLSESSPFGVYYADAEGGCTYVNQRWQSIFGLRLEDCMGHGWAATIHPEDRSFVFEHWQKTAGKGLDFSYEYRILRTDDCLRYVHSQAHAVLESDGTIVGYVGAVEDITERRQRDIDLRKALSFLDRTGSTAGVGGWMVDIATQEIEWSKETCRIHGVEEGYRPTMEEALAFYPPEAREKVRDALQRSIAAGMGWDLELPFNPRGGEPIWVRAVGGVEFENDVPVRVVGAFQDVTSRVKKRLALEEARVRMTLATDSGRIGIWDYNVVTGELLWDEWMYRLYGLDPSDATGTYDLWARHLHPEDRAAAERALQDALNDVCPFDTEFRVILNNGDMRYLRGSGNITRNDQGRPIRMIGVNWDVTSERCLRQELAEQHEQLRVTLGSIGDAVITTDAYGNVDWLNPVAERMTGWMSDEAHGRTLTQVFHIVNEETRLPTENPVATCLEQGKIVGLANHTLLISRDGLEYGIEDSAAPIRDSEGNVLGVVLVFHDVTEQRRLSGEMSFRASHDALTGLVNRAEFEMRLRRLLQQSHVDSSQHSLLFIDLDQFKLVNDSCGHAMGDQLLLQVSKLLAETARSRDCLARLGGDEFAILLEQCASEQALRVAQQICDRMDDFRFVHDERRFRIGASIGLVPVDNRWKTTEAIMQAADTSCYAAKEAGRNRVHAWFDTDMAMRARHGEMQWTTRIEQALDEDRFVLYAQKIIPIQVEDERIHAEMLIRMLDADGSIIAPGAFIPAAERFHLITRIDRWVLKQTLHWLAALDTLGSIRNISVNLSGQSVGDRVFHRHVIDMLKNAGKDICEKLTFEITETVAVTNLADAALFMEQVRSLGGRIALDDFGAGASSFGYLKNMEVDFLKIDGQFVQKLTTERLDEAAVRCFVDVAGIVGVKTVAEYVDNPVTLAALKSMGVDYAQGFLLHKPAPLAELFLMA